VRESRPIVLIAVTSGLLSVMLAVAVNVATGGTLPGPLSGVSWLAWPAVALLAAIAVALAILQQSPGPKQPDPRPRPVPRELPAAVTTFAGRSDLAAVNRVLADGCRVLAVSGPPGAGKSTLALHVAHERRDQFPAGELFAALRGAEPEPDPVAPEQVLTRFLDRLGVPEDERRGGLDDLAARYRSAVADRRMLIVLDNALNAAQVRPLLPGGPGCLVIITSRVLIADLPHAVSHPLGGLDDADARELFVRAASDARVDADPEGVSRIVKLCGGLPLAVRIAAARLKARPAWTPSDLADRLADQRRRLAELQHEDLAVRSSFEASYRDLSDADRVVFRRAGSHPGRVFGPAAAAALAQLDEATTSATLERLVDMHLVESPAPDRYRLHDLLRIFAAERLSLEEPEYRPASYLDWLAANASTEERENIVAGARHAVAVGAYEAAWTIVDAVHPLLTDAADHPDRLALWREAATAAAGLGDETRRARALRWVSSAYRNAGEVRRALAPAEEAVAIAQRLGDRAAEAEALTVYGESLRDLSRFAEARTALERALDLFVELGDVDEEVEVRVALGTLFNSLWQPELAAPVLERARELMQSAQDHRRPWTLLGLSTAYRFTGRRGEAVALNTRALELARDGNDRFAYGHGLIERGWLAFDERRDEDAARDIRAALELFEQIRHGLGIGLAHQATGEVASAAGRPGGRAAGRPADAIAACDAAIDQFERLRDPVRSGRARLLRAHALADLGRDAQARAEWRAAERLIGDTPLPDAPRRRESLQERLEGL
jgi:tetratricopeptide (TPR) repeat protein